MSALSIVSVVAAWPWFTAREQLDARLRTRGRSRRWRDVQTLPGTSEHRAAEARP